MDLRSTNCIFRLGVVCLALLVPQVGSAQDISEEAKGFVKKATVQIFMGDKRTGSEKLGEKIGGWGSGCFVNRSGLVITNNHVVNPAHGAADPTAALEARLRFSLLQYRVIARGGTDEEKTYKAEVIYQCEAADLALLQTLDENGEPLATPEYLEVSPAHNAKKGQRMWLFGYPGGDKMSIGRGKTAPVTTTRGNIIDVPRRPSGRITEIITDVRAAPGNSGGPMVNAQGQIVGIVSTIGVDDRSASKVNARLVPGDLVVDMVRVADKLNKLASGADLEPFQDLRDSGPSGSGPGTSALAISLDIDDKDLVATARLLESNKTDEAGIRLERALDKPTLRSMPKAMQEQVRALHGEYLLRTGAYDEALSTFKKLRKANVEHVKAYANGRAFLLKKYSEGTYDGQPLSDTEVLRRLSRDTAESIVTKARTVLLAYNKALPKKHSEWKRLKGEFEKLEKQLWVANSLEPGSAENHIYQLWRLRQDANFHEIRRLLGTTKELDRKVEDYNANIKRLKSRSDIKRAQGKHASLVRRLDRFNEQLTRARREWEDMHELLDSNGPAGFRLDDPAALDILD